MAPVLDQRGVDALFLVAGRLIAGFFVLLSVALAHFASPYWLFCTAFVGLNLFQSGLTNWCPMMWILAKAGIKSAREGSSCSR